MSFIPRDYQLKLDADSDEAWQNGHRNVIAVSPTGSGKTKFMGMKARKLVRPGVAIAHRKELVGQISAAMAELGVPHRLIAADGTVRNCIQRHIKSVGRSWVDPKAKFTVSSVDTLIARKDDVGMAQWASEIGLWMVDEAHHLLSDNKWGRGIAMFPNAYGLGVTATPLRADRKSLSRQQGGVFDHMVLGPTMRDLINSGSLCEYRIYAPPASIDQALLKVGATGDFTPNSMRDAAHKSQIVGDVVQTYLRLAPGKRGICFAVDVEQAVEFADAFNLAGVRAAAVSANTPEAVRDSVIDKFSAGLLDMLVNVDLFGEGFDVPAVEVVIMARPTESYGLYVQQFGRALRTLLGKLFGIIIDHVGNVMRHGLPDRPIVWKLFDEEVGKRRKKDPDLMPTSTCPSCYWPYEAFHPKCPHCGFKPEPAGRSTPQQVAGDLVELDPAILAKMRGEAAAVMKESPVVVTDARSAMVSRGWNERIEAQKELRDMIATWAYKYHAAGETDSEIHRRFWYRFGNDVMTVQTLGAREAHDLKMEIQDALA